MSTQVQISPARKLMTVFIITLLLLVGLPSMSARAASTWTVDRTDDTNDGSCVSGGCSLRDAISAALTGDTIELGVTSITLTVGQINISGKNLIITKPGGGNTLITAAAASRIFYVSTGSTLTLSNVELTGGAPATAAIPDGTTSGGAIFVGGTSVLNATNVTFSGNAAEIGGAVGSNNSSLTFTNCTFSNNVANNSVTSAGGGAIYAVGTSSLSITGGSFSGNQATGTGTNGGAIQTTVGGTISGATFSNNTAIVNTTSKGGAIYNSSAASALTVTNSTFTGNQAGIWGGAIDDAASATITGSTFASNSTLGLGADRGGAIRLPAGGTIKNSTFSGNTAGGATSGGGALAISTATTINNSTFAGNTATGGGAIYVNGTLAVPATVTLSNTILANSITSANCSAGTYGSFANGGTNLQYGGTTSNSCGTFTNADPTLGALGNNSGPTPTMALLTGSPAINTGGTGATACETTDQRGVARVGACDIGAFEYDPTVVSGDTTPPVVSIVTKPTNPSNDNTPTFTFSATDTGGSGVARYECYLDSGSYVTCASPKSYSTQTDGPHTFYVRAVDVAGNTSSPVSYPWTIDTVAPTVTIGSPSPSLTRSGPVNFTITLAGADTVNLANTDVTLNTSGTATGTVAVTGSGTTTRTVTISSISGDGTLGISITAGIASDAAGNTSVATGPSTTFDVDNTAPTVTIGTPSASLTRTGPISFSITVAGATTVNLANANVTLNKTSTADGTVAVTNGTTNNPTVTISGITGNGTLGISIAAGIASDTAGNTSASAGPSTTFVVDNIAPVTSIDTKPASITKDTAAVFTFSATDTGGSGITGYECSLDSSSFTACTSGHDFGPITSDGLHTFQVQAVDAAGNKAPVTYTWTVDTTTQSPILTAPAANTIKPQTTTVTYTLPETPLAGSVKLIFDDGGTPYTLTLTDVTSASFELDPTNVAGSPNVVSGSNIPTGQYTVILSYQDNLGNPAATDDSASAKIGHFDLTGNTGGQSGVLLSYEDDGHKSVTSISGGAYTLPVSYNWVGSVTPSKDGWAFNPHYKDYSGVTSNLSNQNYDANDTQYNISGTTGVGGVTLSYLDPGPKSVVSLADGTYVLLVSWDWTGTVTPSKVGYTFAPASLSYANVLENKINQNYAPTAIVYTISGNAGVAGAVLKYTDGTAKTAIADASGNYSFTVSYNWSGTVTPSKIGYIFTPPSLAYTNVLADKTLQNYAAAKKVTFTSTGTYDGWVLESTEKSNKGGSLDSTSTTFRLGDEISNLQYRSILHFDTRSLPDNAVIQSVILRIKQVGAPTGTNPFKVLGNLLVDIRRGPFGGANALIASDFQAAASVAKIVSFSKTPVSGWYSATLNATGRLNINKKGVTQFRLYFAKDDNNDGGADYMKFASGNSAAASRPQLIIIYTMP